MATQTATADRRQRRRQETITEVLDVAVAIMEEHGVAGLSVGEVARRMGIRPPSLYVYFPSKHALYDALFERGAALLLEQMRPVVALASEVTSLDAALRPAADTFVRWSVEHRAYSQLLFWRPVPGFTPSEQAYAPAVELVETTVTALASMQERGLVRPDVDAHDVHRDWTVLVSGVVSQQLSNAPEESFEAGRFTAAIPDLVAMFTQHYGPTTSGRAHSSKESRRDRTR